MPTVNIAKYTRPDVFIEEYNNSVIASQTAQGLTNIIIGVSKTGPINTPVLITNTTDLQNIFGSYDRNLERKGSYFQRTIAQMIQSSPVYAINLLKTDDTLDTLQYAPLSTATDNTNDVIRTGPYRKFFNTTGFWKLDPDALLELTQSNVDYSKRLLNLTNTSSGYITVFIFKSTITGYDITMLNYYTTVENMPPYVYPTDYVSDYMVDVIVLAGDWSNYQSLSTDKVWSKYFDNTGLLKDQVNNFINNNNVTLIKYYQGLSFIPYFRDLNNKNIFIETVINNETQTTGLFCAFNIDLFETNYPTYQVDLIGNNLVQTDNLIDNTVTTLDYLSYSDSLIENVTYTDTILDTVGNVFAIDTSANLRSDTLGNSYRTNYYAEDILSGITYHDNFGGPSSSVIITFATSSTPYAVINGGLVNIDLSTASFTVNATDWATSSSTQSFYVAYKLSTNGIISQVEPITYGTASMPSVSATDMVVCYKKIQTLNNNIVACVNTPISSDGINYADVSQFTFVNTNSATNEFKLTFTDTAGTIPTNDYIRYRTLKRFNAFKNILQSVNSNEVVILYSTKTGSSDSQKKASLENMTVTIVNSTSVDKSITIRTNLGIGASDWNTVILNWSNNGFIMYKTDNEQIFSDYTMLTTNQPLNTSGPGGTGSFGVIAKYSDFYKNYESGIINTGDYFYGNILNVANIGTFSFISMSGSNYIAASLDTAVSMDVYPFDAVTYNTISIPDSVLNTGAFTISDNHNFAAQLGYNATYTYAYKVSDSITPEILTNVTTIYDVATKYYLSVSTDTSGVITANITDSSLIEYNANGPLTANPGLAFNQIWNVISKKSAYKQTVELSIPNGYTQNLYNNIILVEGSKYANVAVGEFLEAYVDTSLLEAGQIPKRLTRIISKKVYAGDTSLVQITCDAIINLTLIGNNYQTMKYSSLDNYVTTYKAIPLKGFRIRNASLPDGTEARLTEILNLVSIGTPLFNAITNKEAISFRYLIDSFGLGLTERSKQQLVDICGYRLDCIGFINMPSMKAFKKSSSPSFVDTDGVLQTAFIAKGGDPNSNPAFLYSFGDGIGASCAGYFCPYVTVSDNGRPTDMPPAMFAATTYMRKLTTNVSSIVPWTIAAGVNDGIVANIADVEMDFTPTDISNLNLAQINPIVRKKSGVFVIETENTAVTLFKSALSFLHVREVLIELEDAITEMLKKFQWKFNTQDTRADIKLKADIICSGFVSKKGLYAFFNQCDDKNNTQTLVDNQIGVLDCYVEPIKGMQMIVANITVLKTGAIASGGFTF